MQQRYQPEEESQPPVSVSLPETTERETPAPVAGQHTPVPAELGLIYNLLKKLPENGFLREAALFRFGEASLNAETFAELLNTLRNPQDRNWRERVVASWILGRATLTPEQAEEATKVLSEVLNDRQIPPARRTLQRSGRAAGRSLYWMGSLFLVGVIAMVTLSANSAGT